MYRVRRVCQGYGLQYVNNSAFGANGADIAPEWLYNNGVAL